MNNQETIEVSIITKENLSSTPITVKQAVDFLYDHLEEFRDTPQAIENAIQYALSEADRNKGFLIAAFKKGELAGLVVMNETGMDSYVPPHFLVYIAVNRNFRKQGIGKLLMKTAIRETKGAISLHVEYDNPAKKLYEAVGFTSKYAEMRLAR
jgi:ribosomal protein S18 acetylase RimI-like enzyme